MKPRQWGANSSNGETWTTASSRPVTLAIWSLLGGVGAIVGWRRRKRAA